MADSKTVQQKKKLIPLLLSEQEIFGTNIINPL